MMLMMKQLETLIRTFDLNVKPLRFAPKSGLIIADRPLILTTFSLLNVALHLTNIDYIIEVTAFTRKSLAA